MEKRDLEKVPQHVGIIMDGNGRWALQKGLPRHKGHLAGADNIPPIARACGEYGVAILSLFAFSSENWRRATSSPQEVLTIMNLARRFCEESIGELTEEGVQLRLLGRLDDVPGKLSVAGLSLGFDLVATIQEALSKTATPDRFTLCIGFNYGGRQEIVDAARRIAQKVLNGTLSVNQITEEVFAAHLYLPDLADPDLIIRTGAGKGQRLSGFMTWQGTYAENYYTPTLWPDFTKEELHEILLWYGATERTFGQVPLR